MSLFSCCLKTTGSVTWQKQEIFSQFLSCESMFGGLFMAQLVMAGITFAVYPLAFSYIRIRCSDLDLIRCDGKLVFHIVEK